jgi:hypothetical protein
MAFELNQEIVDEAWDYMSNEFGSKVRDKVDSQEMDVVSDFLEGIGVMDRDLFMDRFATTVMDVIYLPRKFDETDLLWSVHLCGHENQHVHQWNVGRERFIIHYIGSKPRRMALEVEAMRVNMELDHFLERRKRNVERWVRKLLGYGLDNSNLATAEKTLSMAQKVIEKGGIETAAGKQLIEFLKHY